MVSYEEVKKNKAINTYIQKEKNRREFFMDENKENEVNNVESEVNQSTNTTATNDKKGFSIAALVLGIIAIVLCCIWYVYLYLVVLLR